MSKLLSLDLKDALNWLFMAVAGAVITGLLTLLQGGDFSIEKLKVIGTAWLIAGLSYITKRYFSNEKWTLFTD